MYICIYVCIYIYIHTYIHTYIYKDQRLNDSEFVGEVSVKSRKSSTYTNSSKVGTKYGVCGFMCVCVHV